MFLYHVLSGSKKVPTDVLREYNIWDLAAESEGGIYGWKMLERCCVESLESVIGIFH